MAGACGRHEPVAVKEKQPKPPVSSLEETWPDDTVERANLLNIAHGASVVSRTGESTLEFSAINAIDGDPSTAWLSPSLDPEQSIVVALPSRSRLTRLGVSSAASAKAAFGSLLIERSLDGVTFEPFTTLRLERRPGEQSFEVPPTDVLYLRATEAEPAGNFTQVYSLYARGTALEPPQPRSLSGCWMINGTLAVFDQSGSSVHGSMGAIRMEGATDGRSYRLRWSRGSEYGVAMVTVAPDNRHLSGFRWHKEAFSLFVADSWFGEKQQRCVEAAPRADPPAMFTTWMARAGRYPLYGLLFDERGQLTPESNPEIDNVAALLASVPGAQVRFVNYGDARRLTTLRSALEARHVALRNAQFVTAAPWRELFTDSMRVMYSTIDLQIRR